MLLTAIALTTQPGHSTDAEKSAQPRHTVVSLAPSNTELIFTLHAEKELIGVSSYCDYPPQAEKITKVGTFVSANLERIARLKPQTILLVDGQESIAAMLAKKGCKVLVLHNSNLADIADNLKLIADLTGHNTEGQAVSAKFSNSLSELKAIQRGKASPSVFCCIWPNPLLTVGKRSYLNDAITVCGGISISKNLPPAYPHFSMERLLLANPDVIILPHESEGKTFLKSPPWSSLKAVKNGRVFYLPDGQHDGLARPTMRIQSGLLWLAKRIHPEIMAQLDQWYARERI